MQQGSEIMCGIAYHCFDVIFQSVLDDIALIVYLKVRIQRGHKIIILGV